MFKWKKTLKETTMIALFSALTFSTTITHANEKIYQTGIASYYASKFDNRKTASGEIFSSNKLTCAHRKLGYGTMIRVTNLSNGKDVVVKVNDNGPHIKGRILDLSIRAAKEIGILQTGTAKVSIEIIGEKDLETT